MPRVIVVGGGLAGCGAALAARRAGAQVTLLERTNMLVGVAIRAGETHGNGNFVCDHELRFMGGGELFDALESIKLHDNMPFPDTSRHPFIYNCGLVEPVVKKILLDAGIVVQVESRAVDVVREKERIRAVNLEGGKTVEGDAFVDCTGARGGIAICNKFGQGCVTCLVKCVAFGDRVSMVEKAGMKEWYRVRGDGTPGRISNGITVYKSTLAPWLQDRLEKEGLVRIPVPAVMVDLSKLGAMGAGRSREFVENLILSDIGPVAKISGFVRLVFEELRKVPGFENVQVDHPGSPRFGHVSAIAIAHRDSAFKVDGLENLFCAGDKSGATSVDGAITSGYLAGHNATRHAAGREPLVLPRTLAIGDWVAYATERYRSGEGVKRPSYGPSRGEYWQRMREIGLDTEDLGRIRSRVEEAGLSGILSCKLA